jgi:hypothetical protein
MVIELLLPKFLKCAISVCSMIRQLYKLNKHVIVTNTSGQCCSRQQELQLTLLACQQGLLWSHSHVDRRIGFSPNYGHLFRNQTFWFQIEVLDFAGPVHCNNVFTDSRFRVDWAESISADIVSSSEFHALIHIIAHNISFAVEFTSAGVCIRFKTIKDLGM